MKKIFFTFFLLINTIDATIIKLDKSFNQKCGLYPANIKNEHLKTREPGTPNQKFDILTKTFTTKVDTQRPVFFILVHGSYSYAFDGIVPKCLWGEVEFIEKIPAGFLGDPYYDNKRPIKFTFGWTGSLNNTDRMKAGQNLANGIIQLREQFPNAKFILCGHSHGGNIINIASKEIAKAKKFNKPLDIALELSTPILKPNRLYFYKPKNIKYIYNYYSLYDFLQINAPGIKARRRFKPIKGCKIYNIRLLIDGKDRSHMKMHSKLIGSKIFKLSQKAKTLYPEIHNLTANLASDSDPKVDLLLVPRPHRRNKEKIAGTDIFWDKFEPESPKILAEKDLLVEEANKLFIPKYHRKINRRIQKFESTIKAIVSGLSYIFSQRYEFRYKNKPRTKIRLNKKTIKFYTI